MHRSRFLVGLFIGGFASLAAGCQSGDTLGALDLGLGGGQQREPQSQVSEDQVRESELRAFCPAVVLREGTAYFNKYAGGGEEDRSKLIFQASITDVTRKCQYNQGSVTVTVAAAGKVVPGPQGAPGAVTVPIRVVVLRGEEVIYSQLHDYQVSVADTAGATQFVFNDPNVVIPGPVDRSIRLMTGFDEGPYDTR